VSPDYSSKERLSRSFADGHIKVAESILLSMSKGTKEIDALRLIET